MADRINPLTDVNPVYERETSVYPDVVRIAMEDGTVATYRLDVEQPHPALLKTVDLIRAMNNSTVGGYKSRHEVVRKPNLWERIQAVKQRG